MKTAVFLIIVATYVCVIESRKIQPPLDKNANIAFINNEGGGAKPPAKASLPVNNKPLTSPNSQGSKAEAPKATPATAKPSLPAAKPTPPAVKPAPPATQKPSPAKAPAASASTPGPSNVQQLINFYDSQGKASPIRPYSYSQAVKQG